MIELAGKIGLIALLISGLPQLTKTLREGNANGLSTWFLIIMNVGFAGMLTYTTGKYGFENEKLLIIDYGFQILVWGTVFKYKLFPRSK